MKLQKNKIKIKKYSHKKISNIKNEDKIFNIRKIKGSEIIKKKVNILCAEFLNFIMSWCSLKFKPSICYVHCCDADGGNGSLQFSGCDLLYIPWTFPWKQSC